MDEINVTTLTFSLRWCNAMWKKKIRLTKNESPICNSDNTKALFQHLHHNKLAITPVSFQSCFIHIKPSNNRNCTVLSNREQSWSTLYNNYSFSSLWTAFWSWHWESHVFNDRKTLVGSVRKEMPNCVWVQKPCNRHIFIALRRKHLKRSLYKEETVV